MTEETKKRTAVFVDGFNFYYGRLKGTDYKWLDIFKLAEYLLRIQDPSSIVTKMMFFSAPVLGRYARHGQDSAMAQETYWTTMCGLYPDRFSVIKGEHQTGKHGTPMKLFLNDAHYQESPSIRVHFLEEKKTDVNLALNMYRAAASGNFDQVVVFSNDRDVEPALDFIQQDFPTVVRGVIFPLRPGGDRPQSGSLTKVANWVVGSIQDEALARSLLPKVVPNVGRKGHVHQPAHWHAGVDQPRPKPQFPATISSTGTSFIQPNIEEEPIDE